MFITPTSTLSAFYKAIMEDLSDGKTLTEQHFLSRYFEAVGYLPEDRFNIQHACAQMYEMYPENDFTMNELKSKMMEEYFLPEGFLKGKSITREIRETVLEIITANREKEDQEEPEEVDVLVDEMKSISIEEQKPKKARVAKHFCPYEACGKPCGKVRVLPDGHVYCSKHHKVMEKKLSQDMKVVVVIKK